MSLPDRLVSKIRVIPCGGCWEWMAALKPNGYGQFQWEGTTKYAHRVVYTLIRGPIPVGLQLDHLCRNRSCVNPTHMEPVTQRENILRGSSPTASQARQSHCLRGHPLTPDNLYTRTDGSRKRECASCHRERQRRSR